MTAENLYKLLDALDELKGDNDLFVKVYYQDKENYCVKFIDAKTGQKVHTMRKNTNRKFKSLDNRGYVEKYVKHYENY